MRNRTEVRPFEAADLGPVLGVWYRSWHAAFPHLQDPHPMGEWRARLRDEIAVHNTIWVAEAAGRVVGFTAMRADDGYIDQLFVDIDVQGSGVGSALLEVARELAPMGLRLHTLVENAPARAFYEKRGFVPGGMETNAFNGQPNIEYVWRPHTDPR